MLVSLRESVKYTQETMEDAVERVKDLQADLGGTEILTPLCNIYKAPSIPGHPLQVSTGSIGRARKVLYSFKEKKISLKRKETQAKLRMI